MIARSRLARTVWLAAVSAATAFAGCDRGTADNRTSSATPAATRPSTGSGAAPGGAQASRPADTPSTDGGAAPAPAAANAEAVAAAPAAEGGAYEIAPAADLAGRLGRLVVAFPEGLATGTRIDVFKPGESKAVQAEYGKLSAELLPGRYDVAVSQKRLGGIEVRAKHDTRVKVGVLRVKAGNNTRIDVLDADGKSKLNGDYGNAQFGLPVGGYHVLVAGQSEPVTIEDGKVVDF
jgi:hypothetical protein